jgi:formylmethanofuran dehydrogenase subunit E
MQRLVLVNDENEVIDEVKVEFLPINLDHLMDKLDSHFQCDGCDCYFENSKSNLTDLDIFCPDCFNKV